MEKWFYRNFFGLLVHQPSKVPGVMPYGPQENLQKPTQWKWLLPCHRVKFHSQSQSQRWVNSK